MSDAPRIITGILLILIGIALSSIILFVKESYSYLLLGILALVIGVVILLNKKEDKIEEVKKIKWKKK
jgi:cadmium resistance protein CadD (predicted permease)